jgi:hypothetical protein
MSDRDRQDLGALGFVCLSSYQRKHSPPTQGVIHPRLRHPSMWGFLAARVEAVLALTRPTLRLSPTPPPPLPLFLPSSPVLQAVWRKLSKPHVENLRPWQSSHRWLPNYAIPKVGGGGKARSSEPRCPLCCLRAVSATCWQRLAERDAKDGQEFIQNRAKSVRSLILERIHWLAERELR